MKLQLIRDTEKFSITPKDFSDTEIFYRRCTTTNYQTIVKNHIIKGGKIDLNATGIELMEKHIIGWKGMVDENQKEIPFDVALCRYLPDEVQAELIEAIRGIGGQSVIEVEKK